MNDTNELIFLWMDLEATGLDERKHDIIEVATIITRRDIDNELFSESHVVELDNPERVIAKMCNYVHEMHTKSGLIEDLTNPNCSRMCLAMIEDRIVTRLRHLGATQAANERDRQVMLAGSSVKLDYDYIKLHMPMLATFLHYRLLDVSNFRTAYPTLVGHGGESNHRALDDIRRSKDLLSRFDKKLRSYGVI